MKIVFGCDPNATDFKLHLMEFVKGLGHEVADFGSDDPIYANVAIRCAQAVAAGEYDRAIVVCGTGIGVSIGAVIMVTGYTLGKIFVYSTFEYAMTKLPYEIAQAAIGAVLGMILCWHCGIRKLYMRTAHVPDPA